MKRTYIVEYFNTGMLGGSVRVYGRKWNAWPWSKWVKVWHYV